MNPRHTEPESPETTRRVLEVELLALDLTSCTRCTGTLAHIEEAIAAVQRAASLCAPRAAACASCSVPPVIEW